MKHDAQTQFKAMTSACWDPDCGSGDATVTAQGAYAASMICLFKTNIECYVCFSDFFLKNESLLQISFS